MTRIKSGHFCGYPTCRGNASWWLAFLLTTLLAGCVEGNDTSVVETRGMIYCPEGAPETFNPQLVTSGTTIDATTHQLYNRLLAYDPKDNSLIPSLAKSWHVTRNGLIITFYLRRDVNFHETEYFTPTRKLNADDVLFSFNRILDQSHPYHKVSGGNYQFFQSVDFAKHIEALEKINDYTIRFKLKQPDSSFLANLATGFAVILSEEYGEYLMAENRPEDIDSWPIGTGPFKLKEYRAGTLIRYYRHRDYWQEASNIDQLLFDITPGNSSRLTKLLARECDVIAYPIAPKMITARGDLTFEEVTSFNIAYLALNTQKPPFNDVNVRRAIAHAIDKEAIINTVYNGNAGAAESIIPEVSWAYSDVIQATPFDLEKARALMKEAGYENGFNLDIWAMPVQRAYNPNALKMAKIIQADLSKLNINVNIISFEWSTFLKKLARGEHQSVLIGWSADHPDPDNFFTPLLSCSATTTGSNRAFWCNKQFDDLIQQALLTSDIEMRKSYYLAAQNLIADQVPLVPLAHSKRSQARHNSVTGKILNSFGGINFSQVRKEQVDN